MSEFGLEYIEVEPGLVVDSNGEIVEDGSGDGLLRVAQLRHDAYLQKKAYEAYIGDLDRVLIKGQAEKKVAYGHVVCAVKSRLYAETDTNIFADLVYERYSAGFASNPRQDETVAQLLDVLAAAKGYRREALPEEARALFDQATQQLPTKSWIETTVARHRAPERRLVAAPEEVA